MMTLSSLGGASSASSLRAACTVPCALVRSYSYKCSCAIIFWGREAEERHSRVTVGSLPCYKSTSRDCGCSAAFLLLTTSVLRPDPFGPR